MYKRKKGRERSKSRERNKWRLKTKEMDQGWQITQAKVHRPIPVCTCFYMALELRLFFTFLNLFLKIERKIFSNVKIKEIKMLSINEALLDHSEQAHYILLRLL